MARLQVPDSSMRPSDRVQARGMCAEVMHVTSRTAHKARPCIVHHGLHSFLWPAAGKHLRGQALKLVDGGATQWQEPKSLRQQLKEKRAPTRNIYSEQK